MVKDRFKFSSNTSINKSIENDLNYKSIFFIGFFQILSLVPGVSRSGIAITAARFLQFKRVDSARISFLLSIPILGAISSVSSILLPEVHTKDEAAYLELYRLAIEDGNISEKERTMLDMQARVYGLTDSRVKHLENWLHENEGSQVDRLKISANEKQLNSKSSEE